MAPSAYDDLLFGEEGVSPKPYVCFVTTDMLGTVHPNDKRTRVEISAPAAN
jgi:hypothetical protein